jgi:hypothetical protein
MNCATCGAGLLTPTEKETCPSCGSRDRNITLYDVAKAYESVAGKIRHEGRTSGRASVEFLHGDDLTRSTGEWVKLDRRVDRVADRYTERIVDRNGKVVVRDVDEPLSQHQGRGSAKRASDDPESRAPAMG